jgi:glycosyltransferase-like protein LARGE
VCTPVVAPPPAQAFPVQQQGYSYDVSPQQVEAHQLQYNKRRARQTRKTKSTQRRNHHSDDDYYYYDNHYNYHLCHRHCHHHHHHYRDDDAGGGVPEDLEFDRGEDEFGEDVPEFGEEVPDNFDAQAFEDGFDEDAMVAMYASAGPRDLPGSGNNYPASGATAVRAGARAICSSKKPGTQEKTAVAEKKKPFDAEKARKKDAAVFRQLRAIHRRHSAHSRGVVRAACDTSGGAGMAIDDKWAALERCGQEAAYGSTAAVNYHVLPAAFPDHIGLAQKRGVVVEHHCGVATATVSAGCTLVTQLSLDRLPQFEQQATSWKGNISAAVYFPFPSPALNEVCHDSNKMVSALQEVAAAYDRLMSLDSNRTVTISLLWATEQVGDEYDSAYPINALRNLALRAAKSDLVLLLDVDFVVSEGAHTAIMNNSSLRSQALNDNVAFVLPAFEQHPKDRGGNFSVIPRSKTELAMLWREHEGDMKEVSAFHVSNFAKGHAPTDYAQWFGPNHTDQDKFAYGVNFKEYYEPYIVMARKNVPEYDERFRGFGMNKISHLYSVAAQGTSFQVLRSHFVIARDHAKSSSWEKNFGESASILESLRSKTKIANLYQRFKQDIDYALCTHVDQQAVEHYHKNDPLQSMTLQLPVQLLTHSTGAQRVLHFEDAQGNGGAAEKPNALLMAPRSAKSLANLSSRQGHKFFFGTFRAVVSDGSVGRNRLEKVWL